MTAPVWLVLALWTFLSEDAACVAAGVLIQRGDLSVGAGVCGCALGILAGDVGLWGVGRYGRSALISLAWARRWVDRGESPAARAALARGAPLAVLVSRFLPGTRLPLYVAAGLSGMTLAAFATSTAVAVSIWTPLLVLTSAGLADAATVAVFAPATRLAGGWVGAAAAAVAVCLGLWVVRRLVATPRSRARLVACVTRLWRWEFWPMWAFYPPVTFWIVWLALRHGGLSTLTAANPGIPDGGTVGESKADILSHLPADAVIPFRLVLPAPIEERRATVRAIVLDAGWTFPLVLKPDVGERGRGIKMAHAMPDVDAYCESCRAPFLIQPFHPGPYEAGVFYYRHPDEVRGHVLSITDKHFPVLIGDGVSTVEALVWAHPRYRMQASLFLARHAASRMRILASGERLALAVAGNHSKGTMFLDGAHLKTAALEQRVDAIARHFPGFYIGRFDVRYTDVDAFMAGDDLAIVELNGATAEPTDLYDPRATLCSAYRKLARQWSLVFAIGAANRARGARVTPIATLIGRLKTHLSLPGMSAD